MNPISKESEPADASMESYSDFESDHFVVRRLRRRASGGKGALPSNEMAEPGVNYVLL